MILEKCRVCKVRTKTDNHHIQSISFGGPDIDWNRCRICPNCHRKVHMFEIIIEGWVMSMSKHGKTLVWRNYGEEKIVEDMEDPKVWLYPDTEI